MPQAEAATSRSARRATRGEFPLPVRVSGLGRNLPLAPLWSRAETQGGDCRRPWSKRLSVTKYDRVLTARGLTGLLAQGTISAPRRRGLSAPPVSDRAKLYPFLRGAHSRMKRLGMMA